MPGSWDLSFFTSASLILTTACQVGKELSLLINRWGKKTQGNISCPRAHSLQMAGLASTLGLLIPPVSIIIYHTNWLSPNPRPQLLFPHHDRLHLPLAWFCQSCLNKGTLCLAEPHQKKCLLRCQAAMCVCVLHFTCICFYSDQSSQQHYERHMISFIWFAEEKSEALKAKWYICYPGKPIAHLECKRKFPDSLKE